MAGGLLGGVESLQENHQVGSLVGEPEVLLSAENYADAGPHLVQQAVVGE